MTAEVTYLSLLSLMMGVAGSACLQDNLLEGLL